MQEVVKGFVGILVGLFCIGVLGVLVFLLAAIGNAVIKGIYERAVPDEDRRKRLVEIIDDSVKGYRNRIRTEHQRIIRWECPSRRFTFHISFQRDAKRYLVNLSFPIPVQSVEESAGRQLDVARGVAIKKDGSLMEREAQALVEPLRFFDRVSVSRSGIFARKIIKREDELQDWHDGLTGIIAFVRYQLDAEKWSEIEVAGQTLCPYCRSAIGEQDEVARCRKCRTVHHEDCWQEQGRCSVFGCGSTSHS